jgi:RNA polymerase sigma-70 factor (ECF subfamily)
MKPIVKKSQSFTLSASDQAEITAAYRQQATKIYRFLLKRSGGDATAADQVLQDTFIAAFKSYTAFKHKSSFFTWLCKISLSKLADYYRQQIHYRSRVVVPALDQLNNLIDPALSPEEKFSLDELRTQVNRCLNLLPVKYRQLLHFKYYQSLTTREICLHLDISPRQLEGRLHRARQALARLLAVSEAQK